MSITPAVLGLELDGAADALADDALAADDPLAADDELDGVAISVINTIQ